MSFYHPHPFSSLSVCTAWEDQKTIAIEHIKRLQRDPLFVRSLFVLIVESNLGYESDHHAEFLRGSDDLHNIVFMRECESRFGVRTSNKTKEQMTLLTLEMLTTKSVLFYNNSVATEDDAPQMKRLLMQQLANLSAKGSITGKRIITGKLNGMQDDLVMAVMMNMLYQRHFLADSTRYGRFFNHNPYA